MSTKLIMIAAGCFLFFSLLNCVIEGTWFDASSLTLFNVIGDLSLLSRSDTNIFNVTGLIAIPINFITVIWNTFTFDYSFLTGMAIILRLFFCVFSFGFIWGVVQLIRGTG